MSEKLDKLEEKTTELRKSFNEICIVISKCLNRLEDLRQMIRKLKEED